jgi:hypothetical protein
MRSPARLQEKIKLAITLSGLVVALLLVLIPSDLSLSAQASNEEVTKSQN